MCKSIPACRVVDEWKEERKQICSPEIGIIRVRGRRWDRGLCQSHLRLLRAQWRMVWATCWIAAFYEHNGGRFGQHAGLLRSGQYTQWAKQQVHILLRDTPEYSLGHLLHQCRIDTFTNQPLNVSQTDLTLTIP